MTPAATATYRILTGGGVGALVAAAHGFLKSIAGCVWAILSIVTIIGISALIFYRVA